MPSQAKLQGKHKRRRSQQERLTSEKKDSHTWHMVDLCTLCIDIALDRQHAWATVGGIHRIAADQLLASQACQVSY
jgi:hypothetical protein